MSQKRHQEEGMPRPEAASAAAGGSSGGSGSSGSSAPEDKRRRFTSLRSVIREVMKLQSFQHLLVPVLEPLIRKVVKEEVELALEKHLNSMKRDYGKEIQGSPTRNLKLQFLNNISLPVFAGTRIEAEVCSSIKIALVDPITEQVVNFGPESSAKVEIVVLEGDFDGDEEENWTIEEFNNNIVRERDGKKALLTGDAFLNLKDGIGLVGDISFTDNSSWTRSRKFSLGARVLEFFDGVQIREAKTESFVVRDHRGELYKKHHPPSLLDEVWRLEKIGKDGAFHKRLNRENIITVKDFLTQLYIDPPRLRHILGTGMSSKMWEVTVDHARTCILDKRLCVYYPNGPQKETGVVFNVVGQLMGLISADEFIHADKLSETEKVDAKNLILLAFQHREDIIYFDDEASIVGGTSHSPSHSPTVLCSSGLPEMDSYCGTKIVSLHQTGRLDFPQPISTPDIISSVYSVGCGSAMDDYSLPSISSMDLGFDQTLGFESQVSDSLICDPEYMTQAFCDDDHLQFVEPGHSLQTQNPNLESQADLHSALSGFMLSRSAAIAKKRWKKVFSVLQWLSIKRVVDLRKRNCAWELQSAV